jgi:Zn ribbon nucleic-acid-binding protein
MSELVDPWREYRRRRNLLLFAFLGGVPLVSITAVAGEKFFHSAAPASVVAVGWMVLFAVAGIRMNFFSCPRCHKPFFLKWWYHDLFAGRCVHCGLPKYTSPGSDHADTRSRRA